MGIIHLGDIVAFNETADHDAAVFCHARGITGKVVGTDTGLFVINVGFDYHVYAKPEHLSLVAAHGDIPVPLDVGN